MSSWLGRGLIWEGQDAMTLERDIRIFEGVRNRVRQERTTRPRQSPL